MTQTLSTIDYIPPPPLRFCDNYGKYNGTLFCGLLPKELEDKILRMKFYMEYGDTMFQLNLYTIIPHSPVNQDEFAYMFLETKEETEFRVKITKEIREMSRKHFDKKVIKDQRMFHQQLTRPRRKNFSVTNQLTESINSNYSMKSVWGFTNCHRDSPYLIRSRMYELPDHYRDNAPALNSNDYFLRIPSIPTKKSIDDLSRLAITRDRLYLPEAMTYANREKNNAYQYKMERRTDENIWNNDFISNMTATYHNNKQIATIRIDNTLGELKKVMKDNGIKGYSKMSKIQMVKAYWKLD